MVQMGQMDEYVEVILCFDELICLKRKISASLNYFPNVPEGSKAK